MDPGFLSSPPAYQLPQFLNFNWVQHMQPLYFHLTDLTAWHINNLATYQQYKHWDQSWGRHPSLLQLNLVSKCF